MCLHYLELLSKMVVPKKSLWVELQYRGEKKRGEKIFPYSGEEKRGKHIRETYR